MISANYKKPPPPQKKKHEFTSWWLNQPLWKICSSTWVHLPQVSGGENVQKCLSCQHPDLYKRFVQDNFPWSKHHRIWGGFTKHTLEGGWYLTKGMMDLIKYAPTPSTTALRRVMDGNFTWGLSSVMKLVRPSCNSQKGGTSSFAPKNGKSEWIWRISDFHRHIWGGVYLEISKSGP